MPTVSRRLVGSVKLHKLKHDIVDINYAKEKIRGIFIPFEHNYIKEGEKQEVYLPVRVLLYDQPNQYGQHAMITQTVDSKTWETADPALRQALSLLPILGNLKDFEFDENQRMDLGPPDAIEGSDDLPF